MTRLLIGHKYVWMTRIVFGQLLYIGIHPKFNSEIRVSQRLQCFPNP
jgi:hypothetical protein